MLLQGDLQSQMMNKFSRHFPLVALDNDAINLFHQMMTVTPNDTRLTSGRNAVTTASGFRPAYASA